MKILCHAVLLLGLAVFLPATAAGDGSFELDDSAITLAVIPNTSPGRTRDIMRLPVRKWDTPLADSLPACRRDTCNTSDSLLCYDPFNLQSPCVLRC
jgi:hypothetical protein